MIKLSISILLAYTIALCSTRSQNRVIPKEDIRFLEMNESIKTLPRKALKPVHYSNVPVSRETSQHTEESRQERKSSDAYHHPYVDYGAHSGHHGSFGWFADFPVQSKHS